MKLGRSPREGLLAQGGYADIRFTFAFLAELNGSVYESEERVVFAHADIFTGIVYRSALTNDDVARLCELTTEQFDAESLAFGHTAGRRTT